MILVALLALLADSPQMPAEQQNAIVQKYCVSCHTDKLRSGGLSMEHFDAATAPPSLTAMMLNKITSGAALTTVLAAPNDPNARDIVSKLSRTGAMGASGVPRPDKAATDAFIQALAVHSSGATDWADGSILREVAGKQGEARAYRLVVACGSVQLAWAPAASKGSFTASVDGQPEVIYDVDGADRLLVPALPTKSLTIRDLFPGETVVFPFTNFPRDSANSCPANDSERRPSGPA